MAGCDGKPGATEFLEEETGWAPGRQQVCFWGTLNEDAYKIQPRVRGPEG